jgi:hypothetical protein
VNRGKPDDNQLNTDALQKVSARSTSSYFEATQTALSIFWLLFYRRS